MTDDTAAKPQTFTCANCGGTFPKGWSDDEAAAEAVGHFGAVPDDAVVVCDDCYGPIMRFNGHPEVQTDRTEFERYLAALLRERFETFDAEALQAWLTKGSV